MFGTPTGLKHRDWEPILVSGDGSAIAPCRGDLGASHAASSGGSWIEHAEIFVGTKPAFIA